MKIGKVKVDNCLSCCFILRRIERKYNLDLLYLKAEVNGVTQNRTCNFICQNQQKKTLCCTRIFTAKKVALHLKLYSDTLIKILLEIFGLWFLYRNHRNKSMPVENLIFFYSFFWHFRLLK